MKVSLSVMCFLGMLSVASSPKATERPNLPLKPAMTVINQSQPTVIKDSSLHPAVNHESWYLSGLVENEQAERFAYYFVVHRNKEHFSYFTQLISMQTGLPIFQSSDKADISLATRLGINFKIGEGFLRYNEISDSWLFGVDTKKGFNLRVESAPMKAHEVSHLNKVSFYILQSKRVNGQISKENKPEFVTSSNAWIAHQWQEAAPEKNIMIERLLCRFYDNQGVMMVRARKGGDVVYSNADLLDRFGESHAVSQFSFISQTNKTSWEVKLVSPKKNFDISTVEPFQVTQKNAGTDYYLGLVKEPSKKENIGSCMIIKEYSSPEK